jgi:methyl-accepting chemotaxis protein
MKFISFLNFSKLQRQLVLTVTLTLIIGFSITTFLNIKHDTTDMEEAERAKIALFSSTVSNVIREEMVTGNAEIVSNWLTNIKNSGSFKEIRLIRANKSEAFSDNQTIDKVNNYLNSKAFPPRLTVKNQDNTVNINKAMFDKAVQSTSEVAYDETINGEPVHTRLIPIVRDDRCVACHGYETNPVRGVLQVSASRTELLNDIKDDAINGITGAIVIIIAISFVMSYLIQKIVIRPIAEVIFKITSAVTQQEQVTSQQASSVNQITTTVEELNASSKQVFAKSEFLASQSKESLSVAQEGQKAVEKSIVEMNQIKDKVGTIADEVLTLSEKTNQIGMIINAVEDIANKTDMLALNASIEAAKAGEHGKGFAVVASEVRSLADQSKKATEKISNLIQEIQSSVNSTVLATEEGAKKVDAGVSHILEAGSTINNSINTIQTTSDSANEISIASRQESLANDQVAEAMTHINNGMKETSNAIKDLHLIAQDLQELVDRRKIRRPEPPTTLK